MSETGENNQRRSGPQNMPMRNPFALDSEPFNRSMEGS